MERKVTLNEKEQKRLMVLNEVVGGKVKARGGAGLLGLSLRHTRRLLAAYRKEGAAALAHGNRGRRPHNAFDDGLRERVAILARSRYAGCNIQHFTDLLEEREGLALSRSSVRRIVFEAGLRGPRRRRPPKHRSRRERYPKEGMLLQTDGSEHKWLEDRGPYLSLVGAIDDATGKVAGALFREEEDSYGYFSLFREIVARYGIPHAVYHDRHSIFQTSPKKPWSLEEQLEGKRKPTQFGRLLEELGITSIASLSPQAKGRVERLWGTFQDRLVSELRLAGASSLEEANKVLKDFLPRYNRHFAVAAAEPGSAYRQVKEGFVPNEVFCFKHQRIVGADNVVRFGKDRLQIVPCHGRSSYARCRVEAHERLDGSLAVYYQGKPLITRLTRPEPAVLRAQAKVLEPVIATATPPVVCHHKPTPDHPWRLWVYRANKE